MRAQQLETPYQQFDVLSQPSPILVASDEWTDANRREETTSERLGFRVGRFLGTMIPHRQNQYSDTELSSKHHLNVRANQRTTSSMMVQIGRQDESPDLVIQPVPIRPRRSITDRPAPDRQIPRFRQKSTAGRLHALRENLLVQYGLRQITETHAAEAILGGTLLLGIVLHGDLSSIATLETEVIEALATILQFALSLFVGSHLAELLVAVAGGVALILYRHWTSRNPQPVAVRLQTV